MSSVVLSFKDCFFKDVDPLIITNKIYKCKHLDVVQKKMVSSIYSQSFDRRNVWDFLFPLIEKQCPIDCLLEILLNCGYIELFSNISIHLKLTEIIQRTSTSLTFDKPSQKLLMKLKIQTHNIQLNDPREYLRLKSKQYEADFLCEAVDIWKMSKADKYAASLCAEIDAYTILYIRKFPTHKLFEKLKKVIPKTSNTLVTQVAYSSRLALAYSIADQEEKGEDFLREAMTASIHLGYCVQLVEMFYIYVFNLIGLYEKYPSERLFDKILKMGDHCTQVLQEETMDEINYFWKRRTYVRLLFCLLGLSNRGNVISGMIVRRKHMQMAKDLIVDLDKLWNGFETRRLMLYYVAKARLAELEGEMDFAVECLDIAVDIGKRGEFGEVIYIESYLNTATEKYNTENGPWNTTTRIALEHADLSDNKFNVKESQSSVCEEENCLSLLTEKHKSMRQKENNDDTKLKQKPEYLYSLLH